MNEDALKETPEVDQTQENNEEKIETPNVDQIQENNEEPKNEEKIETPEIKPTEEIKTVSKEKVKMILSRLNDVAFKFDDCVFKVTYINEGQNRFSATCINIEY